MNKIILKLILIFSLTITLGCGFTVVDKSIKNFSIKEIKTSGEKRINFKIKNNILSNVQDNQETSLLLNIDTKKIKEVKEKNIKNQITKYQITINVEINYKKIGTSKKIKNGFTIAGDYLVGDNYSKTLINEKKLIDDLTDLMSKKILKEIKLKINDL